MADQRFARLKTDPRFRRPKKQENKVVVDPRFSSLFSAKKTKSKPSVNKYGLPVSKTQDTDNLKRFYRFDEGEEPRRPDLARGEVLLESSDESEDEQISRDSDSNDENDDEPVVLGNDDDEEINLNEDEFADLDAQAAAYSRQVEGDSQPTGDRTNRIAVVNLDWDHVRASHLFKVFSSLVSPTAPPFRAPEAEPSSSKPQKGTKIAQGSILDVTIYPSTFGKERMAREDKEGPPPEVFKRRKESEEVNEKTIYELGGEENVNENALRKYQLERLRYYYAIVTCSSVETAAHCYAELEGTEFERSANVFDLSFVPDDVSFEDEPREKATTDSDGYKALEFSTEALRHSKVKLTWDEDDVDRALVTKRAMTKKDIEDNDFSNLIASASESESEAAGKPNQPARDALRALLLKGNDDTLPEGWGDDNDEDDKDVDMQVTFTSGLSRSKTADEETTLDSYKRKMKEKRKARKEKLKNGNGNGEAKPKDEFFGDDDESDGSSSSTDQNALAVLRARRPATAEELSQLVGDGPSNNGQKHFDLKAVIKAEKKTKLKDKRKGKNRASTINEDEAQEDFSLDLADNRFAAVHEDPSFAIDPSNPRFKKTKGMSALLDERVRRQSSKRRRSPSPTGTGDGDLQSLARKVKQKSDTSSRRPGKRRR
ncbi:pre-rRNA-processing protein ESF1 [Flagelloscypha sp. PMI_526]|nr:pre-rRNA-processing protein ESF1 [Flagelloscypha sp. PMI_526]